MDNADYAAVLDDIAQLLALTDTNPFRVKAYDNAARTLRALQEPVDPLVAAGKATSIAGVGKGIAADLAEIRATGTCDALDTLRAAIPPGYAELIRVRGLGPKRIRLLRDELGIDDLDALVGAATSGTLAAVAGIGARTAASLLVEAERVRASATGTPPGTAWRIGQQLRARVQALLPGAAVSLAGSLARGDELHRVVALVVATDEPVREVGLRIADALREAPALQNVSVEAEPRGAARGALLTAAAGAGLQLSLVVSPRELSARHWIEATATPALLDALRGRPGWATATMTPCSDPATLLREAGVAALPAELLHRPDWLDASPAQLAGLVSPDDLRRDLHLHTTWSDGRNTIAEMAAAAARRGYDGIAVTDHSRSLTVARGLDRDRLSGQLGEVAAGDWPVRVWRGLEVDILADGTLDMDDDLLARLDWVVGSVHSHMTQPHDTMTARLLRAISSGRIHALGHPTGRILGGRPGYTFDIDAVFDACAHHRVALELNAAPERLDLDDGLLSRAATRPGLMFTINTDAHSVSEFDQMHHGIRMARRAGLPASRILNCLTLDDFEARQRPRGNA
jgi:DNA polymerase (family 10)